MKELRALFSRALFSRTQATTERAWASEGPRGGWAVYNVRLGEMGKGEREWRLNERGVLVLWGDSAKQFEQAGHSMFNTSIKVQFNLYICI